MSAITPKDYTQLVKRDEVAQFCIRCLDKVGVNRAHAEALAEVLVTGDYRGHYSHGLNRLEMYVIDVQERVCATNLEPVIEKETVSTALINGNHLLGPVIGNFAMETAIRKAKQTGIALVSAYGSNHYGIAGWYSLMAAKEGLLGMSFTNTSPLVYPTRSKERALGTNPMTFAAPSSRPGDEFVLDMATSAVALGKLEMRRREKLPIPDGWAADGQGHSTTDPTVAITEGALMPLGGEEHTSGYKGYGLGMMIEVLCGILAGANYGLGIRKWMSTEQVANLGQTFIAIDPNVFASGFTDRLSEYMGVMRGLSRADEDKPVLIPGDPERNHMKECDELGGIRYPPVLLESLEKLADRLQVKRLPVHKSF